MWLGLRTEDEGTAHVIDLPQMEEVKGTKTRGDINARTKRGVDKILGGQSDHGGVASLRV